MEKLAVVILGVDEPNISHELFKLVSVSACHVVDVRLFFLGSELSINLCLSGRWSAVAKFEAGLAVLEKRYKLKALIRRTQSQPSQPTMLPYSSYIVAPDNPDVLYKIMEFLLGYSVNIHDFHVISYKAPVTEAAMLGISLAFNLPLTKLVADFRECFVVFCDEHNFDIMMEPQKS